MKRELSEHYVNIDILNWEQKVQMGISRHPIWNGWRGKRKLEIIRPSKAKFSKAEHGPLALSENKSDFAPSLQEIYSNKYW